MFDIVDIKSEVKNGNLKFEIRDGYILCMDTISGECVRVSTEKVELARPKTWQLGCKDNCKYVIQFDRGVFFANLFAGDQGKYDGEITVTRFLDQARTYESLTMIEAQLRSVKHSLKKNPYLSNPRIVPVFIG